jgi:MFS transporter, UMF1 family
MFSKEMLQPGVRPREVVAWAGYDFANSGYTTVVLTAVFNAYFVGVAANNAAWATLAWTLTTSASYLLIMLIMPAIGAWADRYAAKKKVLAWSTVGCVLSTAALSLVGRGDMALAIGLIIASNVFFSVGESMTAAFLPELARPESMGKVSGWGWSFGYFGGMLALGLSLAYVISAKKAGLTATSFVPVTMWITAGIYALASIPLFLLLRERAQAQIPSANATSKGVFQGLRASWAMSAHYEDFRRFMLCGVFYQAGIAVVITLAAIYAEQAMKFTQEQTMALIFVVNIAATIGAFLFGYLQDRLGHRRALAFTLYGWLLMIAMAGLSTSPTVFWMAATMAGLCMGSSQSCGRALVGTFAPVKQSAEFFGLWTFATRLASIIGPIAYGVVTTLTDGNHRLAILTTGLFFIVGLVVLQRVNVERGQVLAASQLAV